MLLLLRLYCFVFRSPAWECAHTALSVASATLMSSIRAAYEPEWHDSEDVYHRLEVAQRFSSFLSLRISRSIGNLIGIDGWNIVQ